MRCEWPCRDLSRVQPASGPKELGVLQALTCDLTCVKRPLIDDLYHIMLVVVVTFVLSLLSMTVCGHATWMRRSDLNSADFSHVRAWGPDSYSAPAASGRMGGKTAANNRFFWVQSHKNEWMHPSILLMRREAGIHPGQVVGPSQDTHIAHSHTQLMCFFWEWERKTEKPRQTCGEHAKGSGEEADRDDARWGARSCD